MMGAAKTTEISLVTGSMMAKKPSTGGQRDVATRAEQPIILIRGFGGLGVEDEKRIAYQGFNDGTVYPQKRGDNYIYEGLILRFMKSRWVYNDATNIVGYYSSPIIRDRSSIPDELAAFDIDLFSGHKVVIDPEPLLALLDLRSMYLKLFGFFDTTIWMTEKTLSVMETPLFA